MITFRAEHQRNKKFSWKHKESESFRNWSEIEKEAINHRRWCLMSVCLSVCLFRRRRNGASSKTNVKLSLTYGYTFLCVPLTSRTGRPKICVYCQGATFDVIFSFYVLFYSRVQMFRLRLLYSRRLIVNGRAVVLAGFRWLLTKGTRVQSQVSVCDSCDGWRGVVYFAVVIFCPASIIRPVLDGKGKGKAFQLQAWRGPWGSRRLRLQNV